MYVSTNIEYLKYNFLSIRVKFHVIQRYSTFYIWREQSHKKEEDFSYTDDGGSTEY